MEGSNKDRFEVRLTHEQTPGGKLSIVQVYSMRRDKWVSIPAQMLYEVIEKYGRLNKEEQR